MANNKNNKYKGMYLPIAIGVGICMGAGFGNFSGSGTQSVPFGILLGLLFGAWLALRK